MSKTQIIYIENAGVKLGILPNIGATIVFLSKNGSENILKSDPTLWDDSTKPEVNPQADFVPYNGHIVWVSPQSNWWTQQNVNQERKDEKAVWPPDPYISYGEYKIIEHTSTSVKLQSPESPVSNVQIEKNFAINPDGSIFQQIAVTNCCSKTVSWDIWLNTRVCGWNSAYVFAQENKVRIDPVTFDGFAEMPYEFTNGMFHYRPTLPPAEFVNRGSKAYIHPEKPSIFAFSKTHVLKISFEHHKESEIHPEQALVEIYNLTDHDLENNLLELEYHSPYKTLESGETMQTWQVWEVEEYNGGNSPEEHTKHLKL